MSQMVDALVEWCMIQCTNKGYAILLDLVHYYPSYIFMWTIHGERFSILCTNTCFHIHLDILKNMVT